MSLGQSVRQRHCEEVNRTLTLPLCVPPTKKSPDDEKCSEMGDYFMLVAYRLPLSCFFNIRSEGKITLSLIGRNFFQLAFRFQEFPPPFCKIYNPSPRDQYRCVAVRQLSGLYGGWNDWIYEKGYEEPYFYTAGLWSFDRK